jgi:rhamnulokinase
LAIDIGASSGRHILGHLENGKMFLEEVYRFENYIKEENGTLCWDIEHLVTEVKNGLKKCKEIGKIPATIAIDTWGVDYVLLDENKKELFPAVAYRDSRTYAAMEEFHQLLSKEEFFAVNGIQPINFNTVYQLFHDKKSGKLSKAKHFLMIPAYLYFKLSGEIKNEYTNLTTGALVSAKTKSLDEETLNLLGVDSSLFGDVCLPTQKIGVFSEEIRAELGFDSTLVFCPTHDTASAVAACPLTDNAMYIS